MSDLAKANRRNAKDLADALPERPSLSLLEHWSDIALARGLRQVMKIIDQDAYTIQEGDTMVSIPVSPDEKIRGFNAIVNLGRLIESRQAREQKGVAPDLEIPSELDITNG